MKRIALLLIGILAAAATATADEEEAPDRYELVNSEADLEEGATYVIAHVNSAGNYRAMSIDNPSTRIKSEIVSVEDNLLTPVENTALFQLEADGEKWIIKNVQYGQYLRVATSGSTLSFSDNSTPCTITFEDDYVVIERTQRVMVYKDDNTYGSYALRYWEEPGSTHYKPSLYRLADSNAQGEEGGVEAPTMDSDRAPAAYYTLQGLPAANPRNGIYIKVQGGKSQKVAL